MGLKIMGISKPNTIYPTIRVTAAANGWVVNPNMHDDGEIVIQLPVGGTHSNHTHLLFEVLSQIVLPRERDDMVEEDPSWKESRKISDDLKKAFTVFLNKMTHLE